MSERRTVETIDADLREVLRYRSARGNRGAPSHALMQELNALLEERQAASDPDAPPTASMPDAGVDEGMISTFRRRMFGR